MKRNDEAGATGATGERLRKAPAGNRGLLVAGLGAALAAVLSLGLLNAASGSSVLAGIVAGVAVLCLLLVGSRAAAPYGNAPGTAQGNARGKEEA